MIVVCFGGLKRLPFWVFADVFFVFLGKHINNHLCVSLKRV